MYHRKCKLYITGKVENMEFHNEPNEPRWAIAWYKLTNLQSHRNEENPVKQIKIIFILERPI